MDRRGFLQLGALAGAGGLLPRATMASPDEPRGGGAAPRRARNLIFMVSDGMSFGTLTLADLASRARRGRASHWVELFDRAGVRRSVQNTASADSLVTDSAAAASAWGCGRRVKNGSINVTPEGRQLLPLLVRAAQAGKATGLVTTARVTHATPAGFIANVPSRNMEQAIGEQILERRVDVALGGGSKFFPADALKRHADVTVVADRGAMLEKQRAPGRLLGLFASSHVPFELDREPTVPTLAEMTAVALARLGGAGDGFVVQIEGGRVDHAAHSNDAPALVSEQLAFDDALGQVLKFIEGRDDTLVVVTTDHGNANPGLTLYNQESFDGMERLAKARRSFDWISARLGPDKAGEHATRAPGVIEEATGIVLNAEERGMLAAALAGRRVAPFAALNGATSVMGGLLANYFGVGFVSGNHTADDVELTALGPGSERFPGAIDNNRVQDLVCAALDLPPGKALEGMERVLELKDSGKTD